MHAFLGLGVFPCRFGFGFGVRFVGMSVSAGVMDLAVVAAAVSVVVIRCHSAVLYRRPRMMMDRALCRFPGLLVGEQHGLPMPMTLTIMIVSGLEIGEIEECAVVESGHGGWGFGLGLGPGLGLGFPFRRGF